MGFLDTLFGSKEGDGSDKWEQVTSQAQVDDILLASNTTPQVILKHSSRCGVSYYAKKNLDSIPDQELAVAELYIIDVIRNREVSHYLADRMGVRHESPQLFVIRDGEAVWHGSHHSVSEENLIQALG